MLFIETREDVKIEIKPEGTQTVTVSMNVGSISELNGFNMCTSFISWQFQNFEKIRNFVFLTILRKLCIFFQKKSKFLGRYD